MAHRSSCNWNRCRRNPSIDVQRESTNSSLGSFLKLFSDAWKCRREFYTLICKGDKVVPYSAQPSAVNFTFHSIAIAAAMQRYSRPSRCLVGYDDAELVAISYRHAKFREDWSCIVAELWRSRLFFFWWNVKIHWTELLHLTRYGTTVSHLQKTFSISA